jgi:hypothetical protein
LPRLAKVNARCGVSGKQKTFCILVIAKSAARRGMSGKQKINCFYRKSIKTLISKAVLSKQLHD